MSRELDEATEAEAPEAPEAPEDTEASTAERGLEAVPEAADGEAALAEARAEVQALRDQLLRKRAEFDNFRRRTARERAVDRTDAAADVLTALLPTVDNLERAAEASGDDSAVQEGLALIMKDMRAFLDKYAVEADDPVGQPFDPARHQALSHEEVPGHADGQIVEVFQKGYAIGDRLLRPALVKVAKGASDPGAAGEEAPAQDGT